MCILALFCCFCLVELVETKCNNHRSVYKMSRRKPEMIDPGDGGWRIIQVPAVNYRQQAEVTNQTGMSFRDLVRQKWTRVEQMN